MTQDGRGEKIRRLRGQEQKQGQDLIVYKRLSENDDSNDDVEGRMCPGCIYANSGNTATYI